MKDLGRRAFKLALVATLTVTAGSTAFARELCGRTFETMLELRANIVADFPKVRDDPQWNAYVDWENHREWFLSKERWRYDAVVCNGIYKDTEGSLIRDARVVCQGPTATCDPVRDEWSEWLKRTNADIRSGRIRK